MKKLNKLRDSVRKYVSMEVTIDVDVEIQLVCDSLDIEELLEVIELSEQPILFDVDTEVDNPEAYIRPAAFKPLQEWLRRECEDILQELPYGDYVQIVDKCLHACGYEDSSEEEMAWLDGLQCDLELPHVAARRIMEYRDGE